PRLGAAAAPLSRPPNYSARPWRGVVTSPAKNARMQLPPRPSCFEFGAQAAPERIGDCRTARAGDLRVGNNRAIGCWDAPLRGQKGDQIRTPDLLLALEETDNVNWKHTSGSQE